MTFPEPARTPEVLTIVKAAGSVEESAVPGQSPVCGGDLVQSASPSSRLLSTIARYGVVLAIGTIVLLNACCFADSLNGYFFADDFVHVSYLFDVFNGHWGRLWDNFTGNWMQASGTQFYRPAITLTLALDYWLGAGSATAFHLSNLIYQTASSVFLFLTCRRILCQYSPARATTAAFLAGALFAVHPLHGEVANWIIGRVDSVCLCFFLCSTWLYLRYRQGGGAFSLAGSLLTFAIALISKEPAAILPPFLVLLELSRQPDPDKPPPTWWRRCWNLVRHTAPFWLTLGGYLIVRTLALGTLIGGYQGSIGEGFNQSIIARLFHQGSLQRIVFPFNAELYAAGDKLRKILPVIYASVVGFFLIRAILNRQFAASLKYPLLAGGWFVLSLLPVLQVFNITETLQCSRFAYAATAPLCFLLAVLLVPLQDGTPRPPRSWFGKFSVGIAALLSISILAVYTGMTWRNNLPWARAAAQVKSFRSCVEEQCASAAPGRKIVVLNVPDRIQGAHMIYNGAMLSVLMSPPLTKVGLNQKVVSFEPVNFGDSNLVDPVRLATELSGTNAFCWWDMKGMKMIRRPVRAQDIRPANLSFDLRDTIGCDSATTARFLSPRLDLPALGCDFVECRVKVPRLPDGGNAYLQIFWTGDVTQGFNGANSLALPLNCDGQEHTYRFPVSQYKTWLKEGTISRVTVELNGSPQRLASAQLSSVSFKHGKQLVPALEWTGNMGCGNDGVRQISGAGAQYQFDCSALPGAVSAVIEISKPNSWFEHYSGNLRDTELSTRALRSVAFPGKTAKLSLKPGDFPQSGFYQIRVAGLDKTGGVIGYTSTPLNVQVSR